MLLLLFKIGFTKINLVIRLTRKLEKRSVTTSIYQQSHIGYSCTYFRFWIGGLINARIQHQSYL